MKTRLIGKFALALSLGAGALSAQTMTIVNGASFNPNGPFAPGSFATMFGEHLCSQTAQGEWIAPGQLPTELGGCMVTVNGMPAMLHYVSPNQVNFIVPEGLGPGQAQVVMHDGTQTMQGMMQVGPAGPGIFGMGGMGIGQGAMLHGTMWQPGPFSVTTNGEPTPVSIFVTGLDLSAEPQVTIGGVPVEVTWYGNAPGFAGLQQINIVLPENLAGVGMVPVAVTSNGVTSNVTFMNILPTTSMMQGMPGWGQGMMVHENMPRGREPSYVAFNPADGTAIVPDEENDALRVISLDTLQTVRTITLPDGSDAHAVAVNEAGTIAAVALSHNNSVALVNLQRPDDIAIIGTGVYPSHLAFAGADLLVTNTGSGTVTVIDTASGDVTRTIDVGFGPAGIAAGAGVAVVANMQGGSVSVISFSDYSVTTIDLPPGTRPHEAAIDAGLNKAVITTPMSNGFLILDLATRQLTQVPTDVWNAMGPGAVVTHNGRAYIANQMTATVTVVNLQNNSVETTFPVDPGPRALALDAAGNRLLVLSHGTGVLSIVDLASYAIIERVNAVEGDRPGRWQLPLVTSISPDSAARGSTITLTITGTNLQDVEEIEFHFTGMGPGMGPGDGMGSGTGMGPGSGMGGGMMGGSHDDDAGFMGGGMMNHDEKIRVSNLQVSPDGTTITATVEIAADAEPGTRRISLETERGHIMGGPMFNTWFTVTE